MNTKQVEAICDLIAGACTAAVLIATKQPGSAAAIVKVGASKAALLALADPDMDDIVRDSGRMALNLRETEDGD